MENTHVSTTFYLSLLEFLMAAKQQIVVIGNEYGLTSIQAITLLLIDEQTPRPMGSLGHLFHCDASNVTGIIDGLEQKGLVERRNAPKDRRVKVVCITAAGRRMQQQIIDRLTTNWNVLFAPLSSEEAGQFVRVIEKVAASTH